ncbi:hypothetical protein Syun_008798 [Stephania yunnanensis]|uniref:Uncharacterized protein n=1 Tax=Stephania yunnanensis TaxID=152371 RepID=A0AAP0PQ04_9MAGN
MCTSAMACDGSGVWCPAAAAAIWCGCAAEELICSGGNGRSDVQRRRRWSRWASGGSSGADVQKSVRERANMCLATRMSGAKRAAEATREDANLQMTAAE